MKETTIATACLSSFITNRTSVVQLLSHGRQCCGEPCRKIVPEMFPPGSGSGWPLPGSVLALSFLAGSLQPTTPNSSQSVATHDLQQQPEKFPRLAHSRTVALHTLSLEKLSTTRNKSRWMLARFPSSSSRSPESSAEPVCAN